MEGKTQRAAAASAAMSERSARKWQRGPLPSERGKDGRSWRTRPDPFAEVWEKGFRLHTGYGNSGTRRRHARL